MSLTWYSGHSFAGGTAVALPTPIAPRLRAASAYLPTQPLVDAVNVALALGQPLLLTGEPGCGKTELAAHLSWSLGLPEALKFETKSNSDSRDVLYQYDSLGHYRSSMLSQSATDARTFIRLAPLGAAILRTLPADERGDLRDPDAVLEQVRSVVLIDEIDKAPRDFPNDLLNEIEQLYFRIPELGLSFRADPSLLPIVVITSNQERNLPGPFLRRCVYHHVTFPDTDAIRAIVIAHLGQQTGYGRLADDVLSAFSALRAEQTGLERKPGIAELLAWLAVNRSQTAATEPLRVEDAERTLGVVAKTTEDLSRARQALKSWDQARRDRR